MSADAPRLTWEGPLPATWALVGVLWVVHLATAAWIADAHLAGPWTALLGERPDRARLAVGGQYAPFLAAQPFRLLTSVLLHVDGFHLAFNAVALLTLGRLLEPLLGAGRFLAVFWLGGLAGSLTAHAVGVLQSDGASGGAFALLAVGVGMGVRLRSDLPPDDAWLLGPVLGGLLVANLALSALVPALDLSAHLGGTLTGAALSWWLVPGPSARAWWWISGAAALICVAGWTLLAFGTRTAAAGG